MVAECKAKVKDRSKVGKETENMEIKGVYDFTVSGIDGNGYQYMTGMLEPERLDSHGLRFGKAFDIGLYHKQQKTTINRFVWLGGAPHNFETVAVIKGEIAVESEVPVLLKKYGLL